MNDKEIDDAIEAPRRRLAAQYGIDKDHLYHIPLEKLQEIIYGIEVADHDSAILRAYALDILDLMIDKSVKELK